MSNNYKGIPIIGFVGFSGSGKTTILTQVIKKLKQKGLEIAVIKHTHHHFDIDKPGKDSYRFRESGANQVIVGSKKRFALMVELTQDEPDLNLLMSKLDISKLDLILFEGFKHEAYPKIEVHRKGHSKDWLYPNDAHIIALATDDLTPQSLPLLHLDDINKITDFILAYCLA